VDWTWQIHGCCGLASGFLFASLLSIWLRFLWAGAFAFGDEAFLLDGGQGERGADFGWKFVEGQVIGGF
jgi:hypothetical protein